MSPFVQDLIAVGIGIAALLYLVRRWWPNVRALFKPTTPASACGQSDNQQTSCGTGCGGCGSMPSQSTKDHRVHIVKRPTSVH